MSEKEKCIYGKDCPKGMVQVEFVGVSPDLKQGEYGWKPSEHAFVDIYIDGERFNIQIGNFESARGGTRRGLHIVGPFDMKVDKHSLNGLDIFLEETGKEKPPTEAGG